MALAKISIFIAMTVAIALLVFLGCGVSQAPNEREVDKDGNPILAKPEPEAGPSQGYLDLEKRLKFYGIRTRNNKFFLPYSDNRIGALKYEKLLLDTSCNGL